MISLFVYYHLIKDLTVMHLTLEMVTEEWKLVTSDVFHDLYQSKRNKRRMT